VAVTVMVMSPRSIFSVRYCSVFDPRAQARETMMIRARAERFNFKKNTSEYDCDSATVEGGEV